MISITTINSTNVKQARFVRTGRRIFFKGYQSNTSCHRAQWLAIGKQRQTILAAPRIAFGSSCMERHRPLGFAGHGIHRDAAQKSQLLALGIPHP